MAQTTTQIDSKYAQQQRRWVHIDAKGAVLGRLASRAAGLLRGKHKPFYTPAVDCGDFVVVTNAAKVKLTGNKIEVKEYFSHSSYAAGMKMTPIKLQMERDPRKVISLAVKRMLPVNRLRQHQLRRLKIYPGESHPHTSQKIEVSRG
ncbi:MAG TPA: 50S ribosomal protein L13 [Elusimicrobiota bacterium]|jgi:large subunit ribosomal protein L13|nr:50S ribosomal protein L13 [Elusimicrobiota bacterium]